MNVDTMITDLRVVLGVDAQELSDSDALRLLNRAYKELDNKFPFKTKDHRIDFDTTIGIYKYELNANLEAIQTVSIKDPDSEAKSVLERMTKTWYEDNTSTNSDARGCPTHYMRESNCVILHPTPDKIYRITIRQEKTLTALANDTDVPDIPEVWHEIIVMGAGWRGFLNLGDFDRLNQVKAHQIALIQSTVPQEAKEEFDTHTGGVQVGGRADYRRYGR